MRDLLQALGADERLMLQLRGLYEQYGYRHTYVSNLEPYELFLNNKNFLKSDAIISFTDSYGKIMALKPDATLSIVNRVASERLDHFERVCYNEKIYRGFKEINQTGIELVGDIDSYCRIEVILLAVFSLQIISPDYLIDISHMGFVSALLDQVSDDLGLRVQIGQHIHQKNTHDLKKLLDGCDIAQEHKDRILQVPLLYGPFEKAMEAARALCVNPKMSQAVDELSKIWGVLKDITDVRKLCLDFSIINDLDYYNGVIFQGYIENAPQVVLTGGNYDNLMKKLGKQSGAIGFAVYLDQVRVPAEQPEEDEAVIRYQTEADIPDIFRQMGELAAKGARFRVEKEAE